MAKDNGKIDVVLDKVTQGYFEQQVPYKIPMSIYPADSNVIIVISPGASESKDGRMNRWTTLARYMQNLNIGTIVTYNPPQPDAQGKFPHEPYSYQVHAPVIHPCRRSPAPQSGPSDLQNN